MEEIKLVPVGDSKYMVVEDYQYMCYTVPKGFITDGASVPKPFTKWFPRVGEPYTTASVIHDWLYHIWVTKIIADIIFLMVCRKFKTKWYIATLFYLVLFFMGWTYYYAKRLYEKIKG